MQNFQIVFKVIFVHSVRMVAIMLFDFQFLLHTAVVVHVML